MASSGIPVCVGDTIFLYCSEEKGYISSDWPVRYNAGEEKEEEKNCFSFSPLNLFKPKELSRKAYMCEDGKEGRKACTCEDGKEAQNAKDDNVWDPGFHNVHFASFEVYGSSMKMKDGRDQDIFAKTFCEEDSPLRTLVYGCKIKLRHVATGKFLSFQQKSNDERDDSMVCLVSHGKGTGQHCMFKVLPSHVGIKKRRGEDVLAGDAIKLKCDNEQGQNILCTYSTLSSRYELKKAEAASAFIVHVHKSTHKNKVPLRAIVSGSVVTLGNLYYEAYLAAHVSIASEVVSDLRKEISSVESSSIKTMSCFDVVATKPKNAIKYFPTSGDSLWQLECFNDPAKGNWLNFGDPVCIKHVPSQKYIAVIEVQNKSVPVLKHFDPASKSPWEFCFHLVPKANEKKAMDRRDHFVIKHGKKTLVFRTWQRSDSSVKEQLSAKHESNFERIFSLEFQEVSADNPLSHHDVFNIDVAYNYLFEDFYHVLGATKVLMEYNSEATALMSTIAVEVMQSLIALIKKNSDERRHVTSMLRVTQAVDLMVMLLRRTDKHTKFPRKVCKLLRMCVETGDRDFKIYMANEQLIREVLLEKVADKIQAERVLVALIDVDFNIGRKLIETVESNLDEPPFDHHLLYLLKDVCVSGEMPVYEHQQKVLKMIVIERNNMLKKTEVDNNVVKFVPSGAKLHDLEANELLFFVAQLKLLSSLCKGVNKDSIKTIMEGEYQLIKFDEAIMCVEDDELNSKVRSAYLEFLSFSVMEDFVEKCGESVENIRHTFNLQSLETDLNKEETKISLTGGGGIQQFEKLQQTIEKLLSNLKECVQKSPELLNQLLKSLKTLVEYKFYAHRDDVRRITELLIDLIAHDSKDYGDRSTACDVTTMALKILRLFFKQFSFLALRQLVYDHYRQDGQSVSTCVTLLEQPRRYPYHGNSGFTAKEYFSHSGYEVFHIFSTQTNYHSKLVNLLISLMSFDESKLRLLACKLLFNIYRREKSLFAEAEMSCFYTADSAKTEDIFVKFVAMKDSGLFLREALQCLFHGRSNGMFQVGNAAKFFQQLGRMIANEGNEYTPNPVNQHLAYSSGLFKVLLEYILMFSKRSDEAHKDIIISACYLLQVIARENKKVQKKLFEKFDDLQEPLTGGEGVAQLLTEMFTNNHELRSQVSQSDIVRMFHCASSHSDHHEFFTTLQAIIMVEKSSPDVDKRFQDAVANQFSESLHDVFSYLIPESEKENREVWSILSQPLDDISSPDNRQMAMLNVCSLLSVCAKSGREIPLEICQKLFSLEMLSKILADTSISLEFKKPFACLITEAHIAFDDASQKAVTLLVDNQEFWKHNEHMTNVMIEVNKFIDRSNPPVKQKMSILLCFLQNHHQSIHGWRKQVAQLDVNDLVIYVNGDSGAEMKIDFTSAFYYIFDGYVPMLTAFCKQLSKLPKNSKKRLLEQITKSSSRVSMLGNITKNISKLSRHEGIFTNSSILAEQLTKCVTGLGYCQFLSVNSEDISSTSGDELPAMVAQPEMDYNESFAKFVTKCQASFEKARQSSTSQNSNTDYCIGQTLIPTDESFKGLLTVCCKIEEDDQCQQRIKKMENLWKMLDAMHLYWLQPRPLTSKERNNLNESLLTCLQLLHSAMLLSFRKLKATNHDIFKQEYEEYIKPLQESFETEASGSNQNMLTASTCNSIKSLQHVIYLTGYPQMKVAVQAMALLATLLYQGNEKVQLQILDVFQHRTSYMFYTIDELIQDATSHFQRLSNRTSDAVGARVHTPTQVENTSSCSGSYSESATLLKNDGLELTSIKVEVQKEEHKFQKHQAQYVGVALDLLAHLCDCQNTGNQHLLREQECQLASVNVVKEVAILLQNIANDLSEESLPIAEKAIKALIEMCAGNLSNQRVALKAQIVTTVITILNSNCNDCEYQDDSFNMMVDKVKSRALEMVYVMAEATSDEHDELLQFVALEISSHVDTILRVIEHLWILEDNLNEMKGDVKREVRQLAKRGYFAAFHVLKRIALSRSQTLKTYVDACASSSVSDTTLESNWWKDISRSSQSVEILYKSDDLQEAVLTRIQFPFSPNEKLEQKQMDFVDDNLNRDSPEDKVKNLMDWMKEVYKYKQRKDKIWKKWWIYWALLLFGPLHYILILLTLLLNILVIFYFTAPGSDEGSGLGNSSSDFPIQTPLLHSSVGIKITFFTLGSFHLLLSIWMIIVYFLEHSPSTSSIREKSEHILQWLKEKTKELQMWHQKCYQASCQNCCKRCCQKCCQDDYDDQDSNSRSTNQQYFEDRFYSFETIYRVLFVIFSILSLAFSGYWYSCCLFYIFLNVNSLRPMLVALRKSAWQLMIVFLLELCILLIYAIISFAFFHSYFDANEGFFCATLVQCFTTVIREGILGSLDDAISLKRPEDDTYSFHVYQWRVVFDLSFFLLVSIIGVNIVVAVLVDHFSELRAKREAIKQDRMRVCFICGLANDEFEKKGKGFQHHITNDHSLWNYLYLYLYLKSVDANDYSALEKYVFDQIEKGDISFFPLYKAQALQDAV